MLQLSKHIIIPSAEIEVRAIRAQGAGGQHVNKVASAIHLRFDIKASSLPDHYKEKLLRINDQRVTRDGVIIIKAQRYRSQEKNRSDALLRLQALLQHVALPVKKRKATAPTKGSKERRLESKVKRGAVKATRGKIEY